MATPPVPLASKGFGSLTVELGDGASPEHFSAPSGFKSRAFNRGTQTSQANVPYQGSDGPGYTATAVTGSTRSVQGSGIVNATDLPTWSAWHEAGSQKDVRVRVWGVEFWVGPAVLTSFNITGAKESDAGLLTFSCTIEQAGPWTYSAGDPAS